MIGPRRASLLGVACLALVACKDKQAPAPVVVTPSTMPAGSAATSPAPRPSLPDDVKQAAPAERPEMSVDDARAALPKIEGTIVLDLKQTSDRRQVHATWCIDGDGAQGVAKLVGQSMSAAGYTGLSIRGDDRKAGVSGDKGAIRMSMVVSASGAASCAAPAHYFASATLFRP